MLNLTKKTCLATKFFLGNPQLPRSQQGLLKNRPACPKDRQARDSDMITSLVAASEREKKIAEKS
jgi:hypothetical protein